MAFTKLVGFVLLATLLISSTMAQSPTPAPAPSRGGGRRISPALSPKKTILSPSPAISPSPETSTSPPSPPLTYSPSDSLAPVVTPSSISNSPTEAPSPAQGGAISNTYTVFGSVAVIILTAAVLAI